MNCCSEDITDAVQEMIESEQYPRDIQSQLEVTGSERGLVLNRDVPFTLVGYYKINDSTGMAALDPKPWDQITLSFTEDLDTTTAIISSETFDVVDKGVFDEEFDPNADTAPDPDSMERWQGVIPASTLNALEGYSWVVAQLKGDDNSLISRCVFKVLGGS